MRQATMNTIPLDVVFTKETFKKQKITLFSPLTSLTVQQSLSSKLQTDLPIQIQFVNSLNELFLEIPKTSPDYIGIDIEELCKDSGIQSFEIISTLKILTEHSTKNKKNLQIIGLADNNTNCKMIKDILSMPTSTSYPLGGHAVTVLGYNLSKQLVLIKNSFGDDWGDNGYGWISFDYINQESFEKWCFEITDQSTI